MDLAKPFSELDSHGLDTRWTKAVDYLFSPADQYFINTTSGGWETDDLFRCGVEVNRNVFYNLLLFVSFWSTPLFNPFVFQFLARLANMAKNRVHLAEEVADLEAKGKKHFDEVHAAKEGQRIAEAKLANVERCIKRDREDFQGKRDKWAIENAGLIKSKEEAVLAKLAAEVKTSEAQQKVVELVARLAEMEKQVRTEEEWLNSWRASKASETFANELGAQA